MHTVHVLSFSQTVVCFVSGRLSSQEAGWCTAKLMWYNVKALLQLLGIEQIQLGLRTNLAPAPSILCTLQAVNGVLYNALVNIVPYNDVERQILTPQVHMIMVLPTDVV